MTVRPLAIFGALVLSLAVVAGSGLLVDETPVAAASWTLNNVHCAHRLYTSATSATYDRVLSGPPFNDAVFTNGYGTSNRADCNDIQPVPMGRYAVSVGDNPIMPGELFLQAWSGQSATATICLRALNSNPESSCSFQQTTTQHWEPKWFPSSVVHELKPHAVGAGIWTIRVGITWPGEFIQWSDQGIVYTLRGPTVLAASLSDPAGTDSYLESDGFKEWRVHDPSGDDVLYVGGIPLQLEPGNSIALINNNVKIRYQTSSEGGNEWLIETVDGEDGVLVKFDGAGTWEIATFV